MTEAYAKIYQQQMAAEARVADATKDSLKTVAERERALQQSNEALASLGASIEANSARWYELEWLVPYKDVIALIGFVAVIVGVAQIYYPASWIVGGAGLVVMGWKMAD